jgi:hypothetical protein
MTRAKRIGAIGVVMLLAAAAPAAAFAHGGPRVTSLTVGGYRAKVDALLVRLSPSRDVVDFTTYLRDRRTGTAVGDASVAVTARTPTGTVGPLRALARTTTCEVLVPVRDPAEWRRIRLHVAIDGPPGRASFEYAPPSLASDWLLEPIVFLGAHLLRRARLPAAPPARRGGACATGGRRRVLGAAAPGPRDCTRRSETSWVRQRG